MCGRFTLAAPEPALRDLIAARFDAEAGDKGGAGAGSIVVKEPGSHVAGLLLSIFPRSRLIFLLRDGRDVIDSWLAAYQPDTWAIEQGAFPVAPWGRLPLIRWLASVWVYRMRVVSQAFERHDPDRRVLIRYEDLREDAEGWLRRACAAAGLEPGDATIGEVARRHAYERVPASERGDARAIRTATSGGWRENLSGVEQQAMHDVMGETLGRFGYLEGVRVAALAR